MYIQHTQVGIRQILQKAQQGMLNDKGAAEDCDAADVHGAHGVGGSVCGQVVVPFGFRAKLGCAERYQFVSSSVLKDGTGYLYSLRLLCISRSPGNPALEILGFPRVGHPSILCRTILVSEYVEVRKVWRSVYARSKLRNRPTSADAVTLKLLETSILADIYEKPRSRVISPMVCVDAVSIVGSETKYRDQSCERSKRDRMPEIISNIVKNS
ncbi:hypothetical protein EV356DRAFT_44975 [Viridothelium virens]|uniref:Uncharacterized protein n=1 Tax=Viridothelium virens TaxID=1048519 RepID=A0A6A6GSZ8_VIRVR|nr:hypothetical protein EV356DRAFT_44975 [Viridothelium virens]